jgi:uncharacterized protein YjiS (DUF1127 family)
MSMTLHLTGFAKARLTRGHGPRRSLFALIATACQRRHLARLDDHLLRDIGLSRTEAQTESARRFWDAPGHWHRNGPTQS